MTNLAKMTPSPTANPKKRAIVEPKTDPQPKKHSGPIKNSTGNRIVFPKGLTQKYCADFLDSNCSCRHGDQYSFVHAVYPHRFLPEDAKLFKEHVEKFDGLSFVDKKVS